MSENILKLLGSQHIIASEDSLIQAKSLEFLFRKNGIKYKIFSNADDAYQSVLEDPPALIISDVIMPGTNGFDYCIKIKKSPELKHIPVILLTGLQDPDDIIKGLQAGADNFITKPFDETDLLVSIEHLLVNRYKSKIAEPENNIDIIFKGREYTISSGKRQIIDLMLSLYETASKKNNELQKTKSELEKSNDELQQANNDLESFSRSVSHDLRSPLSVILGFAGILKDLSENLNESEREYVNHIINSGNQMLLLINDLMAFAQSGVAEIKKESFDLSELVRECAEKLREEEKSYRFDIEIEGGVIVSADRALIKIAIDNLIGNAVKYSSKSEHPKVTFGVNKRFGSRYIFIRDNGVGFEPEKATKLFQPFVRLHGNEFGGTGVGLSTVKKIIERHGGEIWAESEPGKGSQFNFTLD